MKVERRVPILLFSRETQRLECLKRSLTIYRLASGQPRQDDLIGYLNTLLDQEMTADDLSNLQISLEPPEILDDTTQVINELFAVE